MCQNSVKIKLPFIFNQYTLQKSKIHTIYLKIVIAKKKKIVCLGHSHPKK